MAKKKARKKDIKDAAHKVWLAGLGALSTAGKEGEKMFHTLVERGQRAEKKVNVPLDKAGARMRVTVKELRGRAGEKLDGLQSTIDDGVHAAMKRLGVPSRDEIDALQERVEQLTRELAGKKKVAKKKTRQ